MNVFIALKGSHFWFLLSLCYVDFSFRYESLSLCYIVSASLCSVIVSLHSDNLVLLMSVCHFVMWVCNSVMPMCHYVL